MPAVGVLEVKSAINPWATIVRQPRKPASNRLAGLSFTAGVHGVELLYFKTLTSTTYYG
jgi:hypothetical protein